MNKKVLIAANLESFYSKFLVPQLKAFKEMGYIVEIATRLEGFDIPYVDKKYDVQFARGLSLKDNKISYKQMRNILKNNKYDLIVCHTPFGSAITRLAAKKEKVNTRIVYMAHGFHFYKGAPLKNWLIFYNAEKYLSKYTDTIITINNDDYEIAKKKFKCKVALVNGVGLDESKFNFKMNEEDKLKLRKSLGLNKDYFVMIYAAELLPRKGQLWLINTLKEILKRNKNFHILLAGKDSMNGKCQKVSEELGLSKQIHFLGFRKDIPYLLNISDLAVSSSNQEGLPVNIMEAVYVGLPIVATSCRGNRDLIQNGKNGYLIEINDNKDFCDKILYYSKLTEKEKKKIALEDKKIIKKYLLDNVIDDIMNIYR